MGLSRVLCLSLLISLSLRGKGSFIVFSLFIMVRLKGVLSSSITFKGLVELFEVIS